MKITYTTLGKTFDTIDEAKAFEDKCINKIDFKDLSTYIKHQFSLFGHPKEFIIIVCKYTNWKKMTFGKYKGYYLGQILLERNDYIKWCINNIKDFKLTGKELEFFNAPYDNITCSYIKAKHRNIFDIVKIIEKYCIKELKEVEHREKYSITSFYFNNFNNVITNHIIDDSF